MAAGRFEAFHTHRRSRRRAGHDYGAAGWYFVTICTHDRLCLLGEIRGGVMGLSATGCLAHACWAEIPVHVPQARLGPFVVMPNHVHGLVGLDDSLPTSVPPVATAVPPVATAVAPLHATALLPTSGAGASGAGASGAGASGAGLRPPSAGSLSSVIRSYKAAVTREARRSGAVFAWQARFHDHVVRDAVAWRRIAEYIRENPRRWHADRFGPHES